MQRDSYKTVTNLPVLVRSEWDERDGISTFLSAPDSFFPLRVLTDRDLDKNTKRGIETWRAVGKIGRERLLAFLELRHAIESRDALALEKAFQRLGGEILSEQSTSPDDRATIDKFAWFMSRQASKSGSETAQRTLAQLLTKWLSRAKLVLWWDSKRFVPALFCPDVESGLYVRALLGVVAGNRTLAVCPRCEKAFVQKRPDQEYCSLRCRESYRVYRFRHRQRGKKSPTTRSRKRARKKGVKHGTSQTR